MIYQRVPDRLEVHWGDVQECLADIAEGSVQTIVTSPPYFDARDYGTAEWDGGDPDCDHGVPAQRRHRKNATSTISSTTKQDETSVRYRHRCGLCGALRLDSQLGIEDSLDAYIARLVEIFEDAARVLRPDGTLWLNLGDTYGQPRPKNLNGASWRAALALQAAGWDLRSCVVWDKQNGMPESARDRVTDAHEYVFLFSRAGSRYYFKHPRKDVHTRSVWRGLTAGYKGAHVAVMPLWLAQHCLLHTSRAGDVVLDPFAGSGTTLVAAALYNRQAVGIDLLLNNCSEQVKRVSREAWKLESADVVDAVGE